MIPTNSNWDEAVKRRKLCEQFKERVKKCLSTDSGAALLKELEGLRRAYVLACKFLSQNHKDWPPNMSEIFNETDEAWEAYFRRQALAEAGKEE